MRRLNIRVIFVASSLCSAIAYGSINDPVRDYLSKFTFYDGQRNFYSDDRLLRLNLDLNAGGRNEVLLSIARDQDGKQGNVWSVYESTVSGYVEVGQMTFSPGGFYLGNIDEINAYGLVTLGPGGGGEGTLSAYLFDGHDLREVEIGSVSRDRQTRELQGQAIVDKYMQKATVGDKAVESLDINTLAREYGIKIDPRSYLQVVQALYKEQQSQASPTATTKSEGTAPVTDKKARATATPQTSQPNRPAQPVSSSWLGK